MAIFHEVIDINPEPMYLLAYHRGHRTHPYDSDRASHRVECRKNSFPP